MTGPSYKHKMQLLDVSRQCSNTSNDEYATPDVSFSNDSYILQRTLFSISLDCLDKATDKMGGIQKSKSDVVVLSNYNYSRNCNGRKETQNTVDKSPQENNNKNYFNRSHSFHNTSVYGHCGTRVAGDQGRKQQSGTKR